MKNLQLSLKKKWFEMTKLGIKTEDYREITPYWIKRLVDKGIFKNCTTESFLNWYNNMPEDLTLNHVINKFSVNTMTLGYPKSGDTERILKLEHKGIEIREGNPEWGAEPGKLYFVIKHGEIINSMKKIEFETFRDLSGGYFVDQIKKEEPSSVNFLNYRKYKVSIELVEESKDVLIERLEKLLEETSGYTRRKLIIDEIKKLKSI